MVYEAILLKLTAFKQRQVTKDYITHMGTQQSLRSVHADIIKE